MKGGVNNPPDLGLFCSLELGKILPLLISVSRDVSQLLFLATKP